MIANAIAQSVTRRIPLKAYLSSDHVSAATGKTLAVVLSKNGAAFANPSAGATNATEIGNGWYYVDLSTTDTATQGPIIVRATASGVDDVETNGQVVDAHNGGFDGVPSAAAAATGGIPTVDVNNAVKVQSGTGANQISLSSGTVTVGTNSDKTGYALTVTPPTAVQVRQEMDSNSTKLANLDATISSRSTYSGGAVASVTAAVTVGTNNDKTGYALSAAGVQAVWDALTSALSTIGSIGKLIVTNLDALVSSRSTYAGSDTAGTTTLLGRLTTTRSANLDNLDATVSSRSTYAGGAVASVTAAVTVGTNNDKTGYSLSVAPPTAVQIRTELDTNSTKLANLDATISSRSTYSGGAVASVTAPVTVGTNSDKTGYALSSSGVQAIWDALTSAFTAIGSVGKLLVTNLDAAVSGCSTYAGGDTSGTTTLLSRLTGTRAGNLDNLDAAVSSRSTYSGGAVASVTAAVTVGTNNDKTGYSLAVTPPTVIQIRTEMDLNSTKLANLDATVSSRSTYAGTDTAGTTTLLGRLTSGRSTNLDNLDVAVSTRSSHTAADVWAVTTRTLSSFGTLVSDVSAAVWGAASRTLSAFAFPVTASSVTDKAGYSLTVAYDPAKTASQAGDAMALTVAYDAAKTALSASSYTAPDNSSITAIKAKTDNLPATPAAVADIPTANQNADALLKRDWTSVTGEAARSVLNALRFIRNKWSITGSTVTVTKEDDVTSAWTAAISTNASQDPVSGADPT